MARIYLVVLLGAMAVGQAISWRTYLDAVAAHGLGRWSHVIADGLFGLEIVATVGLLARGDGIAPALVALAVTIGWATIALQAFVRRKTILNCGCFGAYFRQPLRWWVLLEDAALLTLAAWHLNSVLRVA